MSNYVTRCAVCGSTWVGSHACSPAARPALAMEDARRADLERRTVELLERLLRGELDPRGVESIRGAPTTEDCHAELRALRAEWEAVRS